MIVTRVTGRQGSEATTAVNIYRYGQQGLTAVPCSDTICMLLSVHGKLWLGTRHTLGQLLKLLEGGVG